MENTARSESVTLTGNVEYKHSGANHAFSRDNWNAYKAEAARGERDARDKNRYNPPLDARLMRAYEYGFMRGQTT